MKIYLINYFWSFCCQTITAHFWPENIIRILLQIADESRCLESQANERKINYNDTLTFTGLEVEVPCSREFLRLPKKMDL
jgi:hypothetical protein